MSIKPANSSVPSTARSCRPARRRATFLLVAAALSGAWCAPAGATDAAQVSLDYARAEQAAGRATLIDIREPEEHATGVAEGAKLLPMQQLPNRIDEIPTAPDQPVLLICRTQNRSSATALALRERGFTNVRFVHGGMSEWQRRGWPMVAPAGTTR